MENKTSMLLAFALGVVVALNWRKIQECLKPCLETLEESSEKGFHGVMGLFMSAKEGVEDLAAEAEIKKKKATEKDDDSHAAATTKRKTRTKTTPKNTKPRARAAKKATKTPRLKVV